MKFTESLLQEKHICKILAGSISLATVSCIHQTRKSGNDKPNILLLIADDLRWNSLGCAGNNIVITPNINALAKDGIRFSNAFVTSAISMVSRASILTGRYMSSHGIRQFGVQLSEDAFAFSYPALLRKAGYWTGYTGKYGVGRIREGSFDFSREYEGRHWIKVNKTDSIHVTSKNLQDALQFLRERPEGKPFLLTVGFFATHAQDNHPDQYLYQPESEKYYADRNIPVPETASDEYFKRLPSFIANEKNEGRIRWHWRFDTPEKYQRYMKAYYRMLTELDQAVGEIIAELKREHVYENTLIVFIGDNGYFHGEHGLADKWYPYEESIRVPLIVVDPRLPESKRNLVNNEFVLNIDVAPFVLAAAGVPAPEIMQGKDFSNLYLRKKAPDWRKDFYYEHPYITSEQRIPSSEAIVTHHDKYIYWPFYNYEEYFNLDEDPHEINNSISETRYQERIKDLKTRFALLKEIAKGSNVGQ